MKAQSEPLFKLVSSFNPMGDQPEAIKQLVCQFHDNKKRQTLLGVTGSGKTFTMANVITQLQKKTLILAPNKTLAAQLFAEFKEFFPSNAVEYFVSYYDYYQPEAYVPGTDTYIEKDAAINDEIDKLRHSTTRSILEREDVIVVASVSCIYGIGSPEEYGEQRLTIFVGDEKDRQTFLRELVAIQYKRNDIDFHRGTFRVRGDVVEIYPAHEEQQIVRVEFFDDVIETISLVDPLRGRILHQLNKIAIFPSSHYVVGEQKLKAAIKTIKRELQVRLKVLKDENKLVEYQRLSQRTLLDIEMLEEMGFCPGIENYSRHLTGAKAGDPPPTLVDYFKKDFLLIIDESHLTIPQIGGMYKGDRARKQTLVDYGFRLPSALDNRPLKFEEFDTKCDMLLYVSATPADYEVQESAGEIVEQIIRPTGLLDPIIEFRSSEFQVDDVLSETRKTIKDGGRVLITTLTKKLSEELTSFYRAAGIKIKYLHSDIDTIERMEIIRDLRLGEIDVIVGINLLREGLDMPEVSLVAILDADKEGFLRSTRSLIQTIGRAARNENGRVIMYGLKKTKSIIEAMKITSDRRIKQQSHNQQMGITPQTIRKKVSGGVIDILRSKKKTTKRDKNKTILSEELTIEQIDAKIIEMRKKMKEAVSELNFEEAAKIRDEIKDLNHIRLML